MRKIAAALRAELKRTGTKARAEGEKKRPDDVRKYLESRLDRVSGLTLREGAKHLDPALRDHLIDEFKRR